MSEHIVIREELELKKPAEKPVTNIFKNIWARVYLNVYGGDFTADNQLTLEAALMEFFLPTTKRKIKRVREVESGVYILDWWSHWLGAGSRELSVPKAALIIFLDILFFFPRLALNVAKVFTEVLPDMIAQLFLLANKKAKEGYKKSRGLPALGYGLGWLVTGLLGGLSKFIYFIGCCITSPIATSIRARNFNYQHDLLPRWLSKTLDFISPFFSHVIVPEISFACYLVIALLLASFIIPGFGFMIAGTTLLGGVAAYMLIDHVLSCLNRNPNGDDLIEPSFFNIGTDRCRYSDRDVSEKYAMGDGANLKARAKVEQEIEETLKYTASLFVRVADIPDSEKSEINNSSTTRTPMPVVSDANRVD